MIKRERYIAPIRDFYESDLIKIITGVRRCGKSVILSQIRDEIAEKTDNIIYLNFEDKFETGGIDSCQKLLDYVYSKRKGSKLYLFFDEIQELDGWQTACKTLRLHNASVFITGSNSKLLSGEFTKELSGRFVSFRIRPFVYRELSEYAVELGKEVPVSDYLVWGGFPGRLEQMTENAQRQYLTDLNATIVINDLIQRYHIKKAELFTAIVNFILRSNARIISSSSVHTYIKQNHSDCSINTVISYLGYLEEAYIIESIGQYSTKVKRELAFFKKVYNCDVSLNSLRSPDNRFDLTHNLENIVYNELLYQSFTLSVFDNGGKEIDFLATKGNKKYYIQVAYSVADEKAYKREFGAFEGLSQLDRKIIITNDDVDFSTSNVEHISLKKFLTEDIK